MNDFDHLYVEELPDRLVVTLADSRAGRGVSEGAVAELHEVCLSLEVDPRLLLLTGFDGGGPSSGRESPEVHEHGCDDAEHSVTSRLFTRIRRLPMPTLAAVDGRALGGGAALAYACDVRIATERAVFGSPVPGCGVLSAVSACWSLSQLVGESLAMQMLLAGRRLDPAAALTAGLVLAVIPAGQLLDHCHSLLDRMNRMSPQALRLTKLVAVNPGSSPSEALAQRLWPRRPGEGEPRATWFLPRQKGWM
ncbi:enoyl-CoA hydratase/isomerase family protein [Streptacidiphilus rugosus]|uniref:enoyl-CoA hydratase/isomerase family protein n=1 Tax=Streptacidiphilus rugosus TaxID=405783 RepID=UPI00056650E3|nr:enoyl-CoA hydratase/isomerase family protein [Streptacidiphilus rugosus]